MKTLTDEDAEAQALRELERLRDQYLDERGDVSQEEREQQRQLHWMRCPKCGDTLLEVVFRGVKVDKCFGCGGVFLDDGELEQLSGKPGWLEALRNFFAESPRTR